MPVVINNIPATVCIDEDAGLAYVTVDGKAVTGNPVTISGGSFSASVSLPTGGLINCTSGTINVTGSVISPNQVQLTFSGTGLNCPGLGGAYSSGAIFDGTVVVPLDGSSDCTV